MLLGEHAFFQLDDVVGNMFVELLEDLAYFILLGGNCGAISDNHLAKVNDAVVVVFAEAESATAPVTLHGRVGTVVGQMLFHLLPLYFSHLACVTDNHFLNASLLVGCFVRSLVGRDIAAIRACNNAILALVEHMVR